MWISIYVNLLNKRDILFGWFVFGSWLVDFIIFNFWFLLIFIGFNEAFLSGGGGDVVFFGVIVFESLYVFEYV